MERDNLVRLMVFCFFILHLMSNSSFTLFIGYITFAQINNQFVN